MPLPIAHGLVGAALVRLIYPKADFENWKPIVIGFVLANCPDLDFIGSFLFGLKGFHRGFSHSLFFACIVSAILFLSLKNQNWRAPCAFSAAFLSHTLLDFLFAESGGVRLLIPFDYNAYKLGAISFSELSGGFNAKDIVTFSIIETLIFAPVFLTTHFLVKRRSV